MAAKQIQKVRQRKRQNAWTSKQTNGRLGAT